MTTKSKSAGAPATRPKLTAAQAQSHARMARALLILRLGLPLVMGVGYAVIFLMVGKSTYAAVFAGLVAATAGLLLAMLFHVIALLGGQIQAKPAPPNERLDDLENDKRLLLRSIREIELDVQLGKLEANEGAELTEPLRRRAVEVLREIDETRVLEQPRGESNITADDRVEREIEAEIRRRVAMLGG